METHDSCDLTRLLDEWLAKVGENKVLVAVEAARQAIAEGDSPESRTATRSSLARAGGASPAIGSLSMPCPPT